MSASYLGSLPVKRATNSFVDENGVLFASMSIISSAASAPLYLPSLGSAYELNSSLAVTRADITHNPTGLSEIIVTAAGPSANARPFYRIQPGAPRIYGLKTSQPVPEPYPYHSSSGGVSVEVTLVATESDRQTILNTYLRGVMPSSIYGLTLPEPASPPRDLTIVDDWSPVQGLPDVNQPKTRAVGYYLGFICMQIRLDLQGSALVAVLSYQESGFMDVRSGDGNFTRLFNYNYPP